MGGTAGSPDVTGIKAMRWMERSGSEGTIHVSNSGYMENDAMCPERTLYFYQEYSVVRRKDAVLKNRFLNFVQIQESRFVGEFSIMLKAVR